MKEREREKGDEVNYTIGNQLEGERESRGHSHSCDQDEDEEKT